MLYSDIKEDVAHGNLYRYEIRREDDCVRVSYLDSGAGVESASVIVGADDLRLVLPAIVRVALGTDVDRAALADALRYSLALVELAPE